MNLDTVTFSKGLEEEIAWKLSIDHEDEYTRIDAIMELCDDCDIKETPAWDFRHELNDLMIALGVYRETTTEELSRCYVFAGGRQTQATPDLRRKGKMYRFEGWDHISVC